MRPRQSYLILAVALATALAAAAPAQTTITPGESSASRVAQFVSDRLAQLDSGHPASLRQARRDLLKPLRDPKADSSFRFQYNAALQQAGLARLASGPDELVAINAIIIAGELATQYSATILERASRDDRPAVRYEAARSTGVMLRAIASGSAAIPANQVDAIFHHLEGLFSIEDNVNVVDALILACNAPQDNTEIRGRSIRVMCNGAAAVAARWRGRDISEEQALVIFRAIDFAFAELIAVQGAGDSDFARCAAISSGQALTFLARWLEANPPADMSEDARLLAVDLGGSAERVLLLAHGSLTGDRQPVRITPLIKDYTQGQRGVTLADIRSAVDEWTGARGRLRSAPYNVQPGAFD